MAISLPVSRGDWKKCQNLASALQDKPVVHAMQAVLFHSKTKTLRSKSCIKHKRKTAIKCMSRGAKMYAIPGHKGACGSCGKEYEK